MKKLNAAIEYAISLLIDPSCIYTINRAWRRALASEMLPYEEPSDLILARLEEAEKKRKKLIEEMPFNRPHNSWEDL